MFVFPHPGNNTQARLAKISMKRGLGKPFFTDHGIISFRMPAVGDEFMRIDQFGGFDDRLAGAAAEIAANARNGAVGAAVVAALT